MGKDRGNRPNQKGRDGERKGSADRVLILRRSVFQSPQFSALSPVGRCIVFELLSIFNGTNNGRLFLSIRDATDRLGLASFHPASRAFKEAEQHGFITNTLASHYRGTAIDGSLARAWRLNFVGPNGKPGSAEAFPDLDYARLDKKTKKRVERRQGAMKRYLTDISSGNFSVVNSTTTMARSVEETTTATTPLVQESTTTPLENGENRAELVEVSTTYINHHIKPETGGDATGMIRTAIYEWWRLASAKDRVRLAKNNGLELIELQRFIDGSGDLEFPKLVALRSAIKQSRAAA